MKLFNLNTTPDNTPVSGLVIAKTVEVKPTSRGTNFLNLTLADSEGEVSAKYWNADTLEQIPQAGEIIYIEGTVGSWNGMRQVTVSTLKPMNLENCTPDQLSALTPVAPESGAVYLAHLEAIVSKFKNHELRTLLNKIVWQDNVDAFVSFPAAQKMHHAVRGGLVWHTTSMVMLASHICDTYDRLYDGIYAIDRELVIAGIILHDICKIREYNVNPLGVCTDYTVEGQLIGHIQMAAIYVNDVCKELGVSDKTRLTLSHIILSHHGQAEYGSPKPPMFPEALIVSEVDMLDARFNAMVNAVQGVEPGEFSERCFAVGTPVFKP